MAKKKSKTQKYKKNLKKKQNKTIQSLNKVETGVENKKIKVESPDKDKQLVSKDKVKYNVPLTGKKQNNKKTGASNNKVAKKIVTTKNDSKKQVVNKDKVKYNVALTEPNLLEKKDVSKRLDASKTEINKNIKEESKKEARKSKNEILERIVGFFKNIKGRVTSRVKLRSQNCKPKKENVIERKGKTTLNNKEIKDQGKKKNIFLRLLYEITHNAHILFNATLILFFLVLVVALIRIEALSTGMILYICGIVLFLSLIALSYNKYISGKIFTVILCTGMGFAIYQMQYTYDFVRNLASNLYEYKTYYVVTFDNGVNKSIYTINKKSVGLLKENCINVERRLNTKLDEVNYMEYDDINQLFDDFYSSKFRAVLVNENQFKYLQNNIQGNKEVKILYEFKVNSKK